MNLETLLNPEHIKHVAIIGGSTYGIISALRGMRAGTTIQEQLQRPDNAIIGTLVAEATMYGPQFPEFVGAAAVGAVVGGIANTIGRGMVTPETPVTEFRDRVYRGAMIGAVAAPLVIPLLGQLTQYFR